MSVEQDRKEMLAKLEASDIINAIREIILAEQEREHSHVHHWEILGVNTLEGSLHPRASLSPSLSNQQTHVLLRCMECKWPMSMALTGKWTEAQVRGRIDASSQTSGEAPSTQARQRPGNPA